MLPKEIKAAADMKAALDARFKAFEDAQTALKLAQDQEKTATTDEIKKLHDAIEQTGTEFQEYVEAQKKAVIKSVNKQINDFIVDKHEEIKNIRKAGAGFVEFIPKAVGDMATGSGSNITAASHLLSTQLGSFNFRDDNALLNLATVSSTNTPVVTYTEMLPKDGNYAFVAEGGSKPQIDWKWENRFAEPKKAAAHEILTDESIQDVARMQSVAETYLRKKHDLFKVDAVYFADGTGENPTGATVAARAFVAGDMTDIFAAGTSNFMDVVNAIITDIYTTQTYTDEAPYMPNIVMVSPIDFFIELVSAKTSTGQPLYPQAGLFNQVTIGGVTIKPWIKIPVGKIFVADMTKDNIVNYIPYKVMIGYINDQLIKNKFTMVGESRYFQYIKNLDLNAFVYDTIATVRAAITAA